MSNQLVLAPEARDDIRHILEWSVSHFGQSVRDGYEELITAGIADVVSQPKRPGSHDRPELGSGIRSWHLVLSRDHVGGNVQRIKRPRHFIIY